MPMALIWNINGVRRQTVPNGGYIEYTKYTRVSKCANGGYIDYK